MTKPLEEMPQPHDAGFVGVKVSWVPDEEAVAVETLEPGYGLAGSFVTARFHACGDSPRVLVGAERPFAEHMLPSVESCHHIAMPPHTHHYRYQVDVGVCRQVPHVVEPGHAMDIRASSRRLRTA